MSEEYTPADAIPSTVTIPVDGEDATAAVFNTGTKDVADRTKAIQNGLEHIATAQSLTTSRNTTDGAKRFRTVADLAALGALSVGSANNKEIALVLDISDAPVPYVYYHGDTTTVFSPFVINAASSTGRWFWLGTGLLGNQPGLPYVDGSGNIQGPSVGGLNAKLQNRVVAINGNWYSSPDDETETEIVSSNTNSYVEAAAFTLTGLAVGDKIHLVFTCHANVTNSVDGSNAVVGLFVDDTRLETALIFFPNDLSDGHIRPVTFSLLFVATATSHEFELKVRGKTSGSTGRLYSPYYGVFTVYRP